MTDLNELKYSQILLRNQKLAKSLSSPEFPIAVLSNITTAQLNDILEYVLRSVNVNARVQSGDYDNILQDAARLSHSKVLIIFWELANILEGLQYKFDEMDEATQGELITKIKSELTFFFQTISGHSQVIMNKFSSRAFTHRMSTPTPFEQMASELNAFISTAAPANTILIDLDKIFARLSVERCVDYRYFYSSKALYAVDFYKDYCQTIAPYILAPLGTSKKAVILDCDNTLWKGILGEDGPDGIDLSAESAEGKIFQEVQSLLLQLQRQGILLGLCSKNNPQDVDQILHKHPDMLIRDKHLSIKKVNWEDKASNLRATAQDLNIGIDSLVFIDDADFEVNLIREQLPEVRALQVPKMLGDYPDMIRSILPLFTSLSTSAEDSARGRMYEEEQHRKDERSTFGNLEDYLRSLELKMTIFVDDRDHLPRIAQLTQKTNQFNLTTQRYTETEIQKFLEGEDSTIYAFQLEDKFGNYGLTGLAIVKIDPAKKNATIDTLLMSCRVIGRNVELAFFNAIMDDLITRKVQTVAARYLKTAKNAQVADLYDRIGFSPETASAEEKTYQLQSVSYTPNDISYIEVHQGSHAKPV